MKIQIIGIKEVNYFSKKKNEQVIGREIHYGVVADRKGLSGYTVASNYISSKDPAYKVYVEVGGFYTMYLDGYKVDYLAPYNGEEFEEVG